MMLLNVIMMAKLICICDKVISINVKENPIIGKLKIEGVKSKTLIERRCSITADTVFCLPMG